MANQVEVNLKFKADRAAAQQTVRSIDGIDNALEQVEKQAARNEAAMKSLERVQNAAFEAQMRAAKSQADIYGDVGSRVSALSGLAGGVGAGQLGGKLMLGADILDAVEATKLLSAELPQLSKQLLSSGKMTTGMVGALQSYVPGMSMAQAQTVTMVASLAAMAAAAGGLVLAFKIANDIIKESGELTTRWVDSNKQYAQVITGTTEDVNAAIAANEERNRALEKERERLQAFVDEADKASGVEGALLDVNKALGLNMGGYKDVKNALEEVNREIDVNVGVNKQLQQALADGATAAADAAAAERQLQVEREELIGKRVALMLNVENLISDGTADQVQKRIDQINREIEVYKKYGDSMEEYQERIYDLSQERLMLVQRVLPLLQSREAEANAVERLNGVMGERITTLTEAAEAAQREAEQQRAVLDAFDSMQSDLDALATTMEDKRVAENEAYEEKLTEITNTYQQQRKQALEEFSLESKEIEQEHLADRANEIENFYAERQKKIDSFNRDELNRLDQYHVDRQRAEEDHRYALEDAAARLDAIAVLQEMRTYTTQERRRDQDFERESRQRAEQFDAQLDQDQEAFDRRQRQEDEAYRREENLRLQHFQRQLQQDESNYRQEVARQAQQHAQTLTALQTQYTREKAQRETAFNTQLTQLRGFNKQELALREAHYKQLEQQMNTYLRTRGAQNAAQNAISFNSGTTPSSAGSSFMLPTLNMDRTITPVNRSTSSTSVSNSRTANAGGVAININGTDSPEQVAAAVERKLSELFEGMVA